MKNKCVFVVGPESSGSKLIAKICSHVLHITEFGKWNGAAWSEKGGHKVCHRSLPYENPPLFPNIDRWISLHKKDYDILFILTTRDIHISEISRFHRWGKPFSQAQQESTYAQTIMARIINGEHPYFIWSYETFMFLKEDYLQCLYKFLHVESSFIPSLKDGNRNKIIDAINHSFIKT